MNAGEFGSSKWVRSDLDVSFSQSKVRARSYLLCFREIDDVGVIDIHTQPSWCMVSSPYIVIMFEVNRLEMSQKGLTELE